MHLCKPLPISKDQKEQGTQQCERINSLGSKITSMADGNGTLYVGTDNGTVLTCHAQQKDQCLYLNKFGSAVTALAFGEGRLFAGTTNGTILTCDPVRVDSCSDLNALAWEITSIQVYAQKLYVGNKNGYAGVCDALISHTCRGYKIKGSGAVNVFKRIGNYVFAANDRISRCKFDQLDQCELYYAPKNTSYNNYYKFSNIESVKGRLYFGRSERVTKLDCFDLNCFSMRFWEQALITSCPQAENQSTLCQNLNTSSSGEQATFVLGRANSPNFYYSNNKNIYFMPLISQQRSLFWESNSTITKTLYVEQ